MVFAIVIVANCVADCIAYEFDGQVDDANTFGEPPLPTTHTSIHKTVVKHVNVREVYSLKLSRKIKSSFISNSVPSDSISN